MLLGFTGRPQVLLRKYVITRNLVPGRTRWTFSMLMHMCGGQQRKGEGKRVPASGVHVCTSTDTTCLVPPICFLLSQGAGEELQLHWGQCQRALTSSLIAGAAALRGPRRWKWVGECGCGDPPGMVLSQDFSLSWVEKEFPPMA